MFIIALFIQPHDSNGRLISFGSPVVLFAEKEGAPKQGGSLPGLLVRHFVLFALLSLKNRRSIPEQSFILLNFVE